MVATDVLKSQLDKVEYADLSNFDPATNTYVIPKRVDIKIEEDSCYLIQIHRSFFNNQTVTLNWNGGSIPPSEFLKIDVLKKMGKMIHVTGIVYNMEEHKDTSIFWNGWLSSDEITILAKM